VRRATASWPTGSSATPTRTFSQPFETYLKTAHRWVLGRIPDAVVDTARKEAARNRFQNVERARKVFLETGFDPFETISGDDLRFLRLNIEKRHVVGHNLGIADESYAEVAQAELPGQTVRLLGEEILRFARLCEGAVAQVHGKLLGYCFARPAEGDGWQPRMPEADE